MMQPQKRIRSLEVFKKRKELMLTKLKKTEEKLQALENKRAKEIGMLAIKCGLAEKDNHQLEQVFLRIAKEQS